MQLPPTILSIDKSGKKKKGLEKSPKKDSKGSVHEKLKQKGDNGIKKSVPANSTTSDISNSERDVSDGDGTEDSNDESKTTPRNGKNKPVPQSKRVGLQPPRTLETTLFDRLEKMYGPRIKRMLEVQYRSVLLF